MLEILNQEVAAGFDAADGDQLGGCFVTPPCYAQMTHMLMGLARGKLVVCLEVVISNIYTTTAVPYGHAHSKARVVIILPQYQSRLSLSLELL